MINKIRKEGKDATGAYDSNWPLWRSPLRQRRALNFFIVPSGRLLILNTHVDGIMDSLTCFTSTSFQVVWPSSSLISTDAALINSPLNSDRIA